MKKEIIKKNNSQEKMLSLESQVLCGGFGDLCVFVWVWVFGVWLSWVWGDSIDISFWTFIIRFFDVSSFDSSASLSKCVFISECDRWRPLLLLLPLRLPLPSVESTVVWRTLRRWRHSWGPLTAGRARPSPHSRTHAKVSALSLSLCLSLSSLEFNFDFREALLLVDFFFFSLSITLTFFSIGA